MSATDGLARLREPFPPHLISIKPQPYKKDSPKGQCRECGGYHGLPAVHLSYVGHAALTDRLLDVDPAWSWEPLAFGPDGLPQLDRNGGLWIRLTILGMTRLGYGDADGKSGGNAIKEAIGDALRNAAMRFGAALDLWHKGDLHADSIDVDEQTAPPVDDRPPASEDDIAAYEADIARSQTPSELTEVGSRIASAGMTDEDRVALRAMFSARMTELRAAS